MESKNGWAFFANRDLALADAIVDNPEFTAEVAFHCQQSIEKFFKAYLFELKIPFQKTHDLGKLYSEIKKIKDWDIDEQALVIIRDIYVEFTKKIAAIVLSEISGD